MVSGKEQATAMIEGFRAGVTMTGVCPVRWYAMRETTTSVCLFVLMQHLLEQRMRAFGGYPVVEVDRQEKIGPVEFDERTLAVEARVRVRLHGL